ncbi:serine hydrolase [Streptomyces sp. HC44]|uniref:Serine hydrolase n=1 Tax=Streptomyces scabichelini TaxID=2711217 RepID=A0A6G4V2M8_9ACTN|nr:serine hydrolase [Streptomyces scabichelini]NGO08137.1 serine hydrolase [Streptomyces scabichelini]
MDSQRARRPGARPSWRRPLLYTGVASVVLVGVTASGTTYVKAQAPGATGLVSSSASPTAGARAADASQTPEATVESVAAAQTPAHTPTPTPTPTPAVDRDAVLAEAMESVAVEGGAEVSVAVLDAGSGEGAAYGDGMFDTASIVKVDILAALLLQAQDAKRELTASEKAYATAMIKNSDNVSASALWDAIGRAEGLAAANKRLGLSGTEGGDGALWGLTQTTAVDQLALLEQVFGDDSELSEASRAYLRGLMGDIAVGQDWGVSAAGSTGSDGSAGSGFALKNGWLPRSQTGLWDINSIGRVTVDGHAYLVAALSKGNSTKAQGISLVEAAAKAAVSSLRDADA